MCSRASCTKENCNIDSKSDLNAFKGIENEHPQSFVENVQINYLAELRPVLKVIKNLYAFATFFVFFDPLLPEGIEIAAEPVIPDTLKRPRSFGNIRNNHAPTLQEGDLVGNGLEWLCVLNSHFADKNMTDPCAFA